MTTTAVRSAKFEPQPGDVLLGPVFRIKVATITIGKKGTIALTYKLGNREQNYYDNKLYKVSLSKWRKLVASEKIRQPWVNE